MTKLNINQDSSDFTYFHSSYIINLWKNYNNTSLYASPANTIYASPLEYKNPDKDNTILLERRISDKESYLQIKTDIRNRTNYLPGGIKYRHFYLIGEFMLCNWGDGIEGKICYLTDGENEAAVYFRNRRLYTDFGEPLTGEIQPGVWTKLEIYFNLEKSSYDIYLGGVCVGGDIKINEKLRKPTEEGCLFDGGYGGIILREWEFTGLRLESKRCEKDGMVYQEVRHSSQFPDDGVVREYLKDKIVFHGDSKSVCVFGKKQKLSDIRMCGNQLYVSAASFNKIFGSSLQGEASVFDEAKKLGYFCAFSGYGNMVIVSKNDDLIKTQDNDFPWLDNQFYSEELMTYPILSFSDAQEISNFISFERPSAERLQNDFERVMGDSKMHPRIILTPKKVSEMRERLKTDSEYKELVSEFLNKADGYLDMPSVYFHYDKNDNMRTLKVAQKEFGYVRDIALAYLLTGDTKYSDKVRTELLNVTKFPDINPNHIIDTGEWMLGLSIGYDWCYDALTEQEREAIENFLIDKCISVLQRAFYSCLPSGGQGVDFQLSNWFVRWKSNYSGFVQKGLMSACLAVAEKNPSLCFDVMEKSIRSMEYMLYGLYPDGVWLESKTYFACVYIAFAVVFPSFMNCLGSTYGLMDYPGVIEGLHTILSYDSAVSSFSFGDDGAREPFSTASSFFKYFADCLGDANLYYWRNRALLNNEKINEFERKRLKLTFPERDVQKSADTKSNIGLFDIMYYNSELEKAEPCFEKVHYARGGEIFTYHENQADENALFVALAGGPTRHYHFHEDGGDFLICKNGELWTWDFGQGNYNIGSIFTRFSGRGEAHNTLVINPSEDMSQKLQSFAPITDYGETENGAFAVLDMTEYYAHHGASKVIRRMDIKDDDIFLTDEMEFTKPARGYFLIQTPANVEMIDENTVKLSQNGKSLTVKLAIDGAVKSELSVGKSRPLAESPKLDGDSQANTDVNSIRIYFETNNKAKISAVF